MRKYEIYQNIRAILSIFSHMGSLKKITLIIFLTIISCSKEDEFPDIHVNESIFIASGGVGSAEYINFYGNLYAWEIIPGGVGGIIIVQGHNDTFMAYDRACTHENTSQNINSNCIISETEDQYIFSCTDCCNSKFSILDGSVSEGPANRGLKIYSTYFDGTHLHITN